MKINGILFHLLTVALSVQLTNSDSSLIHGGLELLSSSSNNSNHNHRIIKRFAPHYPFHNNQPHMPTLARPVFPFPLFAPPPPSRPRPRPRPPSIHSQRPGHSGTFPNIRVRLPSDENLYTDEEEDDTLMNPNPIPKKKKRNKKKKGTTTTEATTTTTTTTKRPRHRVSRKPSTTTLIPEIGPNYIEPQKSEELMTSSQEKGESGEIEQKKYKRKPAVVSNSDRTTTTIPPPTDLITRRQEDRTLLTAKKAFLIKNAIILHKVKKNAQAAALAYGLNKMAKVKGVSIRAPGLNLAIGSHTKQNAAANAVIAKAPGEDGEEIDEDDDDDDGYDVIESLETDDDDDKDGAIEITPPPPQQQQPPSQPTTSLEIQFQPGRPQPPPLPPPSPQELQTQAHQLPPQQVTNVPPVPETIPQTPITTTMMQQLQEHLLQKQQEEYLHKQYAQAQAQAQQTAETYHQANQHKQQQQQQQPLGIVLSYTPGGPSPVPPPLPHVPPVDTDTDVDEPELYTKGSKGSNKKGKKKAERPKPRPVELGVKANLYKKFDQLAKQTKNRLSTFIQVDVDFLSRRSATDDLVVEPGNVGGNTNNRISSRIMEDVDDRDRPTKNINNRKQYDSNAATSAVQVPGNYFPPWVKPVWRSEYPNCGIGCLLKPIYIAYSGSRDE